MKKIKGWSCFSLRAACSTTHRVTTKKCFWCKAKRPDSIFPTITDTEMIDWLLVQHTIVCPFRNREEIKAKMRAEAKG